LKALSEPILRSPISIAFRILGPASRTVKRLTFVLQGIRCRLNLVLVLWSSMASGRLLLILLISHCAYFELGVCGFKPSFTGESVLKAKQLLVRYYPSDL